MGARLIYAGTSGLRTPEVIRDKLDASSGARPAPKIVMQ